MPTPAIPYACDVANPLGLTMGSIPHEDCSKPTIVPLTTRHARIPDRAPLVFHLWYLHFSQHIKAVLERLMSPTYAFEYRFACQDYIIQYILQGVTSRWNLQGSLDYILVIHHGVVLIERCLYVASWPHYLYMAIPIHEKTLFYDAIGPCTSLYFVYCPRISILPFAHDHLL